jgi:hypothetical protein
MAAAKRPFTGAIHSDGVTSMASSAIWHNNMGACSDFIDGWPGSRLAGALAGLAITVGMATPAPLVQAADAPGTTPQTTPEIIVTTPRGSASGGIDPLLELSPSELDSYGADSLSDLVQALRPLTRSSRSDQMAVVLINGHLAGQTEFDNLPREAIERVEVLPESVALQYGFSENQRVLNFVLRERYSAVPIRATESGATEGGGQAIAADASLVRLNDEARVTLLTSYKDNSWLRDSDRGIDVADSSYYTLLPDTTDTKVAATVSRSILGVSSSSKRHTMSRPPARCRGSSRTRARPRMRSNSLWIKATPFEPPVSPCS